MRQFIRSLLSAKVGAEVATSWGDKFDDGWLVELFDISLVYDFDADFRVEDTHFPEKAFTLKHVVTLEFTVLNFHLELHVKWES